MSEPRKLSWSYETARTKAEAIDAAACATSWLDHLAGIDLGHEGDHAVGEALKNVRAVSGYIRRRGRKGA